MFVTFIVGAFPPEIDLIAKKYNHTFQETDFLNSDRARKFFFIESWDLGIGHIASAFSLQQKILEYQLARTPWSVVEILFFGSAGIYKNNVKEDLLCTPGSYAWSRDFYFKDIRSLSGEAKQLSNSSSYVSTETGELGKKINNFLQKDKNLSFPKESITVNTTASLSLKDPFGGDLDDIAQKNNGSQNDFILVNLEVFSLAYVAQKYLIPFTAYFSLTNYVNEQGSEDWKKNYRFMFCELQKRVIDCIKKM